MDTDEDCIVSVTTDRENEELFGIKLHWALITLVSLLSQIVQQHVGRRLAALLQYLINQSVSQAIIQSSATTAAV